MSNMRSAAHTPPRCGAGGGEGGAGGDGERLELAEVDEGDDVVDNSGEQDELACSQLHV